MGRVKYSWFLLFILLACNKPKKNNVDHEISLLEAALDCAYMNFTLREAHYLENQYSKGEITKKLNSELKQIFDNNNLIRDRFTTLIENRNTNNFKKSELIERLDYFKESTRKVLDENDKIKFDKFLDKTGYYEGIKSDYRNNEELEIILLKKYLIVRLATLEAIQLIYN